MLELLKTSGTENAVFLLKLAGTGQERHTMIRELDVDPVSRQIRHIDFQRVVMTEKVRVQVHIELTGTAEGVKNEGGIVDFVTREVEIECLPGDIPRHLTADVTALHVGQHIEAKDLALPPGVVLLEDAERVIAAVTHSRLAVEEEAPAETLIEAESRRAGGHPPRQGRGRRSLRRSASSSSWVSAIRASGTPRAVTTSASAWWRSWRGGGGSPSTSRSATRGWAATGRSCWRRRRPS